MATTKKNRRRPSPSRKRNRARQIKAASPAAQFAGAAAGYGAGRFLLRDQPVSALDALGRVFAYLAGYAIFAEKGPAAARAYIEGTKLGKAA